MQVPFFLYSHHPINIHNLTTLTTLLLIGVPRSSLVVLAATCDQFNLNPAVITLILGVDQIMDMARASVNVLGNCLASVVVSKWEGVFRTCNSSTILDADEDDVESPPVKQL